MNRVLFVCHGNICRSPMAEFVMKDMVRRRGFAADFLIASAATSAEELGNPVHRGTVRKLAQLGIPLEERRAVRLTRNDYTKYDYLLGMDSENIHNMLRILGEDPDRKINRLLDFAAFPRNIADPWYTGDFDQTYDDIAEGCSALLDQITREA